MRKWTAAVAATAVLAAGSLVVDLPPAAAVQFPQTTLVSDDPAGFTPHVLDGEVDAIAQVGNLIVLGGSFTQVSNAAGTVIYQRRNVVAFDATTGVVSTTFDPSPDGQVNAVVPAADGTSVYLGGSFNTVAGQTRRKLARVDVATGANVAGFANVAADGVVKDLRLVDGRLWVAGAFTVISGSSQASLATLNPTTGAATPYMGLPVSGTHNGGTTQVIKIDASPDGDRLVGIGNFTSVDGGPRDQIVMLDLTGGSAALADWQTDFFTSTCASIFNTYMRDLDFSPDGSFFVVSTTGAYRGVGTACDTTSRFDVQRTGSAIAPEWIDYTGGDTTYAVAVTETAVYVGGHMRWENNPFAGDTPGAGAVSREGIAALDPSNGLPLDWNPTRTRGVGVFDFLATSTGLWVGSDTDRIGAYEYHGRIAFLPLAGGRAVPATPAPTLPGTVVQLAPRDDAASSAVLYRINAAGPALPASDGGPDWAADNGPSSPYRVGGPNIATYSGGVTTTPEVPVTTPNAVFDTERWDDAAAPEMQWSFPVPAGTPIEVRLYLANRYAGTAGVGQRVFSVALDGTTVLGSYDIVADTGGTNIGTMKAFDVTSDGSVDLLFTHQVENPLVDAIEIVRTDLDPSTSTSVVRTTAFTGTSVTASMDTTGAVDWAGVRGAFMLNGVVYLAQADGSFVRRAFDGAEWGPPVPVNTSDLLVPLTAWHSAASRVTGLFYDDGRMYYTELGDATLRMRYFTADSDVVGAQELTVPASVPGVDLSTIEGMFLASGWVYLVQPDGSLARVPWDDGGFAGAAEVVSGPALDGTDWRSLAPFVYQASDGSMVNFPPTADAAVSCVDQACTFSAAGSADPDGSIASYSWDFGDGQVGTGVQTSHSYPASGDYEVELTVTDDRGASSTVVTTVAVTFVDDEPTAAFAVTCDSLACSFDASASSDAEGPISGYDWDFGDGATGTGATVDHTFAAAGDYSVSLTVTDSAGQQATDTQTVSVSQVFVDPVAVFGVSCGGLSCSFDGSGSSDGDGPIVSWVWDFGDGQVGSGQLVEHTFAAGGDYPVSLTVTDGQGATGSVSQVVPVVEVVSGIGFVDAVSVNTNATTFAVPVSAAAQVGDVMVLAFAGNSTAPSVTVPVGWVQAAGGTSPTGVQGWVWTKPVVASDLGGSVQVVVNATSYVKADVTLLTYRGVDTVSPVADAAVGFESTVTTDHATPVVTGVAGGVLVSYWGEKSSATTSLTAPVGVEQRSASTGTGGGRITALAADSAVGAGTAGGLVAVADTASGRALTASLVLRPAGPPVFVDPVAVFGVSCGGLSCSFDGSGSSDGDGPIVSWVWDFGDGQVGSGQLVEHTFAAGGDYPVSLTVTDGQGATGSVSQVVPVVEVVSGIGFVDAVSVNTNATTFAVPVSAAAQVGDVMVLAFAGNSTAPSVTVPVGWVQAAGGTSPTGVQGWVWTKPVVASDLGGSVQVVVNATSYVKADVTLLTYRGVDTVSPVADAAVGFESTVTTDHATPVVTGVAGGVLVSYWGEKSSATTSLTAPVGVEQRSASTGTGGGRITALAADSAVGAGTAGGLVAVADTASGRAFTASLVLRPAG